MKWNYLHSRWKHTDTLETTRISTRLECTIMLFQTGTCTWKNTLLMASLKIIRHLNPASRTINWHAIICSPVRLWTWNLLGYYSHTTPILFTQGPISLPSIMGSLSPFLYYFNPLLHAPQVQHYCLPLLFSPYQVCALNCSEVIWEPYRHSEFWRQIYGDWAPPSVRMPSSQGWAPSWVTGHCSLLEVQTPSLVEKQPPMCIVHRFFFCFFFCWNSCSLR